MHLLIKTTEQSQPFYINHSNYHEGDAGLDLFTLEDITIPSGKMGKIDTGIMCEALTDNKTKGLSFYMYPRSSISKTPLRLANSVGIIDRDYRGHLIGCFDNISNEDYVVEKGTRLLQICAPNLEPITFELVEKLSETSRGTGSFGSTGK
tara:strand:+ start:71 stop:520 length:450 start_codon:yes stop_codon:yes gene_type:complete